MYSYTPAGLIAGKRLQVDGHNLDATYTYNTEGVVASVQHPSAHNDAGKTYTYSFDSMNRFSGLVDNQSTPLTWVQSVVYGPSNELQQMQMNFSVSNGVVETRTYNTLLQLTGINDQTYQNIGYVYSATQNNGRIMQAVGSGLGTVSYAYDSLNRLTTASSSTWGDTYNYDGFGNLTDKTVTAGSGPALHVYVNPANNQISTSGYSYDATGNLTAVTTRSQPLTMCRTVWRPTCRARAGSSIIPTGRTTCGCGRSRRADRRKCTFTERRARSPGNSTTGLANSRRCGGAYTLDRGGWWSFRTSWDRAGPATIRTGKEVAAMWTVSRPTTRTAPAAWITRGTGTIRAR
jgi:YD repeat-containing protein